MGIHIFFSNTSELSVVDHTFEVDDGSRQLSLPALLCFRLQDLFPTVNELDLWEEREGLECVFVYPSVTVTRAIQNLSDAWPLYEALFGPEAHTHWQKALQQLWAMERPYVQLNCRDCDSLHETLVAPWLRKVFGRGVESIPKVKNLNPDFFELFPEQPLPNPFPAYLRRGCARPWPHQTFQMKVTWECPADALLSWALIGLDATGRWVPTGYAVRTAESATAAQALALNELSPTLQRLCLVVWVEGVALAALHHLWLRLYDTDCVAETLYGANAWGNATAAIALEWHREADGWSICATGTPLELGLEPWLAQIGGAKGSFFSVWVDCEPRNYDVRANMFIERSLPRGQRVPWADCVPDHVAYWCVSHSAPPVMAEVRVYDAGGRLLGTVPSDSASCWPGLASVAQGIWRVDLDQLPAAATRLQCCLYSATPLNGLDFVWARWFRAPHVVCSTLYGSNALDERTVAVVAELVRDGGQWWLAAPEELTELQSDGPLPQSSKPCRPGIDAAWYLELLRSRRFNFDLDSDYPDSRWNRDTSFAMDLLRAKQSIAPQNHDFSGYDYCLHLLAIQALWPWTDIVEGDTWLGVSCGDANIRFDMVYLDGNGHPTQTFPAMTSFTDHTWSLTPSLIPESIRRVQVRMRCPATKNGAFWVRMYANSMLYSSLHMTSEFVDPCPVVWEMYWKGGQWRNSWLFRGGGARSDAFDIWPIGDDAAQLGFQRTTEFDLGFVEVLLERLLLKLNVVSQHPNLPVEFGSRELALGVLADHFQLPLPNWPTNMERTPCWDLFDRWKNLAANDFAPWLIAACDQCTATSPGAEHHHHLPHHLFVAPVLWLVLDLRRVRGLDNPPLHHPLLAGCDPHCDDPRFDAAE